MPVDRGRLTAEQIHERAHALTTRNAHGRTERTLEYKCTMEEENKSHYTQLGSHFTNTATARVRPPWIYRYNIKTPDVLVYIFFPQAGQIRPYQLTNATPRW